MKMSCEEIEVSFLRSTVKCYTAHLGFGDYDKIFAFAKWRCPVSYRVHGSGPYGLYDGIEAVFADGTSDWMSCCQIRDVIERNWEYMRVVLSEDEDLAKYSQYIGDHDTLTLKCSRMLFMTSDTKGLVFDRIFGKVKHEFVRKGLNNV